MQKKRTIPDFSENSLEHQKCNEDKETAFRAWQYNVVDEFKSKTVEEIKQHLQQTAFPFAVLFEHWSYDFNLATGIRNANAFNAKEVFYIGDKRWDKRGARGVYHYTPVKWLSTIDELLKLKTKYTFVGVDNVPGSIPISDYVWKPNTLLIFGEESTGLTPKMQSLCSAIVKIEQFGSVRSMNCGTASGIIMYDFVRQFKSSHNSK